MAFPIIGDFVDQVRFNLGGRTDIDARISNWLKKAYREIAMGYPFETLEDTEETVLVSGIDSYDYPENARAMKALTVINGSSPIPLTKKNIQVVRRYQVNTSGVPAIWAPFGGEGQQFLIRPVPQQGFPLIMDYWLLPDIDANETDASVINEVFVRLPDDWFEILEQLATQKAHMDLQEADKAQAIATLLHGDPSSSKGQPGMIKEHRNRDQSENALSNYGMRPRMRRYT